MADTHTVQSDPRADVAVRDLRESDLPQADEILRSAFDTFLGASDLFGDKDYVRTRWLADPRSALAAELDGRLAGSNFLTRWGSVGFFGPLSVRPELWDRGVASRLLARTMEVFDHWQLRHAGLFTFAHSPKHLALYQKFGFWPRHLTPVMVRPVDGAVREDPRITRLSTLSQEERQAALDACRLLTGSAYEGLDVEREITAVLEQSLGDVLLLDGGTRLAGMAVCHLGGGTEAGSGGCYLKFAMVRPGAGAAERFTALLDGCEAWAASSGSRHVELGVNTARHEAYAAVVARGYRAVMVGVAMHRRDDEGYSRPGVWLVDDWR